MAVAVFFDKEAHVRQLIHQAYKHGIFLVEWHFRQYNTKPSARISRKDLLKHLHKETTKLAAAHMAKLNFIQIIFF